MISFPIGSGGPARKCRRCVFCATVVGFRIGTTSWIALLTEVSRPTWRPNLEQL
jgi:hypothetical protein